MEAATTIYLYDADICMIPIFQKLLQEIEERKKKWKKKKQKDEKE